MALIQTAAARTVSVKSTNRSPPRSSTNQHTSQRQTRTPEQQQSPALHKDCGDCDLLQDSSSLSSDRIVVCRDCCENVTMSVRRKRGSASSCYGCSAQFLRKVFIGYVTIALALMPLAQCMESTVSGSGGSNTLRHTHNHHAHNKEQQIGQNFLGGASGGHHASSSSSNSKNSISSSSVSSSHYQSSEETDADMQQQQPLYTRPKRIHQKQQQPQNRATPLHHSEHSKSLYNTSNPHPAPSCNVLCKRYDMKERSLKFIRNRILTKLSMFNRSSDKAMQHKVPLEIIEQFCKAECVGSRCECFPKKSSDDEEKEQEKHDNQHMDEPDEEELMQGDDPFPDSLRNRREEMEADSETREIIEEEDDDYFAITNTVYVFPVKNGESNFDYLFHCER